MLVSRAPVRGLHGLTDQVTSPCIHKRLIEIHEFLHLPRVRLPSWMLPGRGQGGLMAILTPRARLRCSHRDV
jgi:hypothetical protein